MNEQIRQLAEQAAELCQTEYESESLRQRQLYNEIFLSKFAQLIAQQCADICTEMAAKCAGLPGDGAVARDCAHWIKKDFGVTE